MQPAQRNVHALLRASTPHLACVVAGQWLGCVRPRYVSTPIAIVPKRSTVIDRPARCASSWGADRGRAETQVLGQRQAERAEAQANPNELTGADLLAAVAAAEVNA